MSTLIQTLKRNAYGAVALLLSVAVMLPTLLIGSASAYSQPTVRSIQMSTSAVNAVATYNVTFTPTATVAIKGIVVDFCTSPIIGLTCTKPSNLNVAASPTSVVLTGAANWTLARANSNRTFVATNSASGTSLTSGTPYSFDFAGTQNPDLGNFYARIYTYASATGASSFPSDGANPDAGAAATDAGGVALSTTSSVEVSGTVQESLTFCVSKLEPTDGCAGTSTPSVTLGEGTPPILVLDSTHVSTDDIWYQLSTNAAGATSVNIKGASAQLTSGLNHIPALLSADATAASMPAGTAAFGMRSAGQDGGVDVTRAAPYDSNTSFGNDPTSITSTYGDTISSASGPVQNANVPLTFGATVSASTPAGIYTAAFSLIATSSY